jgi:N-carbamoyl-L-amino-acid hydrolase
VSVNDLLAQLAHIGLTSGGGYRRFTWTAEYADLRQWFVEQARARQLQVEKDRNGNLWAYLGDPEEGEVVAVGSHLDSVPEGGAFDGPLGIASAFAALDLLSQQGLAPRRPIAVVAFTEEEGARFGVACLGSRLLTGAIDPERARALTDADGVSLAEAMRGAGEESSRLGAEPSVLARLHSYVELHIEQGRGLVDFDSPVGIGSEIWPHGRWRIDFPGAANHAGTTRMEDRDDPMARFANTVVRVLEAARSDSTRATFGRVEVIPNSINSIPSRVTAWLDARAATNEALASVIASAGSGVLITAESTTPRVEFDPDLRHRLAGLLGGVPLLPTAAGHDAGVLSEAGVSSAMLFVRNPTGVSHSPAEHATAEDCAAGTEALARVLTDLGGFQ